jgi:hypothetical protein
MGGRAGGLMTMTYGSGLAGSVHPAGIWRDGGARIRTMSLWSMCASRAAAVRIVHSDFVAGRLAGVATLASGRFAMMEDGLGFQLVPWQPVLNKQIGKHISGVMREAGGAPMPEQKEVAF